jgi:hypothetical protein
MLTVSELVERCAPPSENHRRLWLRRARVWARDGTLPTLNYPVGRGRHRQFDDDAVTLARVLFRLSDLGIAPALAMNEDALGDAVGALCQAAVQLGYTRQFKKRPAPPRARRRKAPS